VAGCLHGAPGDNAVLGPLEGKEKIGQGRRGMGKYLLENYHLGSMFE